MPVELEHRGAALAHVGRHLAAVDLLQGIPQRRQEPSEALAEARQVRLHLVVDEGVLDVEEPHRLDVQLLEDLVLEPLDAGQLVGVADPHQHLGERLAELHAGGGARRPAQLDDPLQRPHVAQQVLVTQLRPGGGPGRQVHARLGVGPHRELEVAVDLLRGERRHRRHQLGHRHQGLVERRVGGEGVGRVGRRGVGAAPEPPPVAAHVPVGELVHDEVADGTAGRRRVEVLEGVGDLSLERLEARGEPTVDERPLPHVGRRLDVGLLEVGVEHEEPVDVPQGHEEVAQGLVDEVGREALGRTGRRGAVEVPAQRVGALDVEHRPGVDDVALGLRHLLALLVDDVAEHVEVLERGGGGEEVRQRPRRSPAGLVAGVGEQRGERVQAVEPAARLVDGLADVVGGEVLHQAVLGLRRRLVAEVVPLRVRHRARLEPDVHRVRLAAVGLAVDLEGHLVDVGAVEVEFREVAARELLQLLHRADADQLAAVLRAPDRQGGSPVALTAERPVDVVLEPLAEAAGADVVGVPTDLVVVGQQQVLHRGGLHVPTAFGDVHQRRAVAPVEGVGVPDRAGAIHQPRLGEVAGDRGVGVLEPGAGVRPRHGLVPRRPHVPHDVAGQVDREQRRQPVLAADLEVPVCGRDVHDAGAVAQGHELVAQHAPGGAKVGAVRGVAVHDRPVAQALQLAADDRLDDPARAVGEDGLDQLFSQPVELARPALAEACRTLDERVAGVVLHRQRGVRRQRPRRGGPGQEVHGARLARCDQPALDEVLAHGGELRIDGGVLDVLAVAE